LRFARKAVATTERSSGPDASDKAEAHWNDVQSSWDLHIQRIRARILEKKTEHDIESAKRDADWAEGDAFDAVDFAEAAVAEAEYAVLDAAWQGLTRTIWRRPLNALRRSQRQQCS